MSNIDNFGVIFGYSFITGVTGATTDTTAVDKN